MEALEGPLRPGRGQTTLHVRIAATNGRAVPVELKVTAPRGMTATVADRRFIVGPGQQSRTVPVALTGCPKGPEGDGEVVVEATFARGKTSVSVPVQNRSDDWKWAAAGVIAAGALAAGALGAWVWNRRRS